MLFSSISFLYYFLPATLILYFVAPKRLKNTVLLIASMVFYAWGERLLVLLFAASIAVNWLMAIIIDASHKRSVKRLFMGFSILVDLGLLGYFKYADFFIDNLNGVLGLSIPLLRIALPIGISFYTFQLLSYVIDVYRGDVRAQKNIVDFAAYVSMFPQLIAGPIVRYADIEKQLTDRKITLDGISSGIFRFAVGLGKKVLLANAFGELCTIYRGSEQPSVLYAWMYAIAFTMQIYFDFSGYSDMAIGLGRIFGFDFMENFNYPYISDSITEFWRRWHMSLSYWFRDYVYIPLGGNRKGPVRQIFNILVVWMLTGLWHGAAWNFVLWGLLYAVLLINEKLWLGKILKKGRVLNHIYVMLFVILGFVLFNAESLPQAVGDVSAMLGFGKIPLVSSEALYYLRNYAVVICAAIIGATPLPRLAVERLGKGRTGERVITVLEPIFVVLILVVVTAYLVDGSFNPFLYFRF